MLPPSSDSSDKLNNGSDDILVAINEMKLAEDISSVKIAVAASSMIDFVVAAVSLVDATLLIRPPVTIAVLDPAGGGGIDPGIGGIDGTVVDFGVVVAVVVEVVGWT